jgi:hypothetical protein
MADSGSRTTIVLAVLSLAGVLGAAVINKWDVLFPPPSGTGPPAGSPSPTPATSPPPSRPDSPQSAPRRPSGDSLASRLPAAFTNLRHIDAAFEFEGACPGVASSGPQLYFVAGSLLVRYNVAARRFAQTVPIGTVLHDIPFSRIDAAYIDRWHYDGAPQLYLFSGTHYARYDLCAEQYEGTAAIDDGFHGLPFHTIDAAYVDEWHYGLTPQLYVFSGDKYARWDILKNSYEDSASIQAGYRGWHFGRVDAAFVEAWHSRASPQLYLLSSHTFARFDLMQDRLVTVDSTSRLRP